MKGFGLCGNNWLLVCWITGFSSAPLRPGEPPGDERSAASMWEGEVICGWIDGTREAPRPCPTLALPPGTAICCQPDGVGKYHTPRGGFPSAVFFVSCVTLPLLPPFNTVESLSMLMTLIPQHYPCQYYTINSPSLLFLL